MVRIPFGVPRRASALTLKPDRRWNIYPGARVDSPVPIYELSIPEVYKDWTWTTNYPDWTELQAYFDHMDKVLDLQKDTAFETVVVSADFNTDEGKWIVKTQDGRTCKARFMIVAAGFAAKRCMPKQPPNQIVHANTRQTFLTCLVSIHSEE